MERGTATFLRVAAGFAGIGKGLLSLGFDSLTGAAPGIPDAQVLRTATASTARRPPPACPPGGGIQGNNQTVDVQKGGTAK